MGHLRILTALLALALLASPAPALAQDAEPDPALKTPGSTVRGGIYDKPFMFDLAGMVAFGGYADVQLRYQRVEGVDDELSFVLRRINLFAFAPVSERVRLAAEFEFEDGGEEIIIELAMIDFEIHEALVFRGGILLSPLGRFNLAHDSPAMDLTERPLVSTRIIPGTFSEVGMGFTGTFWPSAGTRITYEAYAVNGFTEAIVGGADNTSLPAGKRNLEDTNLSPSFVGRVGFSPHPTLDVGVSTHAGRYNQSTVEDFEVDDPRHVALLALDAELNVDALRVVFEYAHAWIELPESLEGIYASRQHGLYLGARYRFLRGLFEALPESVFAVASRFEFLDMDRDGPGDDTYRIIAGLNFRPTEDTVFKLDYQHTWTFDALNTPAREASVLFQIATYF